MYAMGRFKMGLCTILSAYEFPKKDSKMGHVCRIKALPILSISACQKGKELDTGSFPFQSLNFNKKDTDHFNI